MHGELKAAVLAANLKLGASGLVSGSFGNVSGADRTTGVCVIKPSGVPYGDLEMETLSVVRIGDGSVLEGLRPSSDTPSHLELYRAFPTIGGIAHTHSSWATSWAQAGRSLPCLGTTHADSFHGDVPCSRELTEAEIAGDYEAATGRAIAEACIAEDPLEVPAVLVAFHGPFTWGADANGAVEAAIALEEASRLAAQTLLLQPLQGVIAPALRQRHHRRKHGPDAYYGQSSAADP